MLTGRDSLVRLIGKRRRSPLSPSLSLLLSSQEATSAHRQGGGGDKYSPNPAAQKAGPAEDNVNRATGAASVPCPVCGDSIRGTDYCVNTHLGGGDGVQLEKRENKQLKLFFDTPNDGQC